MTPFLFHVTEHTMSTIEVTVSGIILNQNDEILLCKSHKWDNKYIIPGGHVEYGEKMENALRRELKEETDLDIYSIKLAGVKEYFEDNSYYKKRHFIFFDYICRTDNTEVVLNDEAQSFTWTKYEDVNHDLLGGDVSNLLRRVFENSVENKVEIFYNY